MRKLVATFISAIVALALPAAADEAQRTISVTGEGRVEVAPDIAIVTLGVREQAKSAEAAMDATSGAMRAVIGRLRSFGIAEKDMQTSGLSLHQVYGDRRNDGQPPKVVGFSAANTLVVTSRDLDRLGGLLDLVVSAGANQFQGLSFDISDRSAALDTTRRAAVADAFARARLYADAAGVELGTVMSITESPAQVAPRALMRAEAVSFDSVPVQAGELTIAARIGLVIAIR